MVPDIETERYVECDLSAVEKRDLVMWAELSEWERLIEIRAANHADLMRFLGAVMEGRTVLYWHGRAPGRAGEFKGKAIQGVCHFIDSPAIRVKWYTAGG